jgi:hypothetical protein
MGRRVSRLWPQGKPDGPQGKSVVCGRRVSQMGRRVSRLWPQGKPDGLQGKSFVAAG